MSTRFELTGKQAKFVAEYLVDGNGTRAAVAAGYGIPGARVAACRVLANHNVQRALQARQTADATRLSIRRDDVLKGLLEAVEQAKSAGNPAAMISGLATIGKMLGFYVAERRQVEVSTNAVPEAELARFEAMSDAELMAVIA